MSILSVFTRHPASVGESYFGHMAFAATFAFWLLMAAGAAIVHAVLPFMFETTASSIIRRLYAMTAGRGVTTADEIYSI